jgi:copper(I)-binding protein
MLRKTFISLLLLPCLFINIPAQAGQADTETNLRIEDAWIAEAPPVSKVMVAYMTLHNSGQQDMEIITASSDMYSSIEFHETVHENGMARMIRHNSLKIPAYSKIELKRGGAHLMLFNPVSPLKAGDTVTIKLITSNNTEKTTTVAVKKLP